MASTPVLSLADDGEALARWVESDWIGQNKRYPAVHTPDPVLAARRRTGCTDKSTHI
ncbi:hypothetical protein C8Q73DRAFT_713483 [Cubamyces lactineus]|nr:hypothetical protein C8Q73DRAFT_713483 [Cubamyces lactineus]